METINGAAAFLLLGGPALRQNMYPSIYPLVDDLSRITAPISLMGAGWHAFPGTWEDSRRYPYTKATLGLLRRIDDSGLPISVRDYRTLNTLHAAGLNAGRMTGCPALYVPEMIGRPFAGFSLDQPRKLVFSLGVNFIKSKTQEAQSKTLITSLRDRFPAAEFVVAFHHSIDPAVTEAVYGKRPRFIQRHLRMARWLDEAGIAYEDISGGVEKLLALYESADFHVGYRVHAHICMSSLRKPSVLLTEDGRGRGLKEVLGGLVFDAYEKYNNAIVPRALTRLKVYDMDRYPAAPGVVEDVLAALTYESERQNPRLAQPAERIDVHHGVMRAYLEELP